MLLIAGAVGAASGAAAGFFVAALRKESGPPVVSMARVCIIEQG